MATSSFYQSSGSSPAAENTIDEQVTAAKTAATTASTASTEAATSATSAAGSLSSFQQYYLGAFSVAPSTTQQGAMYFDLASSQLKIWSGSAWEITASSTSISNTDDVAEGSTNLYFTNERVDDRVNGLLVAGSNVTLTYDDAANTLTIASTGGGSGISSPSDFTDLGDTPANYTGKADQILRVNNYATGVEFFDITASDLNMQGNKVLFGNMYSAESDLPSASTYHGMFAHVHGTGKGYFAHGGSWHKLLDETSSTTSDLTEGTNLYYTDARVSSHLNSSSATTGQFLKWNGSDFAWDSVSGASGEAYVDIQTTTGTAPSASGTDAIAIGKNASAGATANISMGDNASTNGTASMAFGQNANASTHTYAIALGQSATTTANQQLMLGAPNGYTGALTSIRVGNTGYTPSNAMDLATKSYVDSNSGSGTSTFTGLTDTPSSMGTSGQYLAVNSGGTALEFVAAPSGGIALTDLSVSTASASGGGALSYNSSTGAFTFTPAVTGGGGIALTDLSAANASASGGGSLAYNNSSGAFTFTPPDLSGYATTSSLANYVTASSTTTFTNKSGNISQWNNDIGYLTNITGQALANLSNVNSTAPTDGQVLTWDNTNSYWKPADASSGGSSPDYLAHGTDADVSGSPTATGDNAIGFGYGASGSGADSIAIGNEAVASGTGAIKIGRDSGTNPISGTTAIGIGWNASATALQSIAIGQNASATSDQGVAIGYAATAGFTESIALGKSASTTSTNQLMLGATTSTDGFTSIRVGNTSYTPTNNMDLATKAYVDANGGGVDWADVSTYHNLAPTTAGNYGMSLGFGAAGTGLMSIALGYKAKASGQNAINISAGPQSGTINDASGADSIVIGTSSEATASDAIAIGDGASADAVRSIAIGKSANVSQATYSDSVAIGNLASVNAANQIMLGGTSITSVRVGNTSYAPSDNMDLATKAYVDTNSGGGSVNYIASDSTGSATASGSTSLAVGDGSIASGTRSLAVGYGADATASYTVSLGHFAEALGQDGVALGYDTNIASSYTGSAVIGRGATATASNQLMLGQANTSGFTSIRVGNTSYTPSNNMDLATKAYVDANAGGGGGGGEDYVTINTTSGTQPTASGTNAISIGQNATSNGATSVSIGVGSDAGASKGVSIGYGSNVGGTGSVAVGSSHSETQFRCYAATYGVSIGHRANASNYAVCMGGFANASTSNCTAVGYGATAAASNATAIGNGASSTSSNKFVLGNTSVNDLRCQDTSITATSDSRDKIDIADLTLGLDFVNSITPKSYRKNNRGEYYTPTYTEEQLDADPSLTQSYTFDQTNYDAGTEKTSWTEFGFLAQDVAAQLPDTYADARVAFSETDDRHGYNKYQFTEGDLIPVLWKAVQELKAKNDALEARVAALENA